jgi:N6-adenosine-specific RNA methylase IME4
MLHKRPRPVLQGRSAADALRHLRRDYRVVIADPPWRFQSNSKRAPGRNAMRHYSCLSLAELCALPIEQHLAKDAVLFLWVPSPFLVIGAHLPVMRAWGFEPSGMGFAWIKLNPRAPTSCFSEHDFAMGGGFTTRKNVELCLLGKRGRSVRQSKAVRELIIARRRQHSRKPNTFYDRVRQYAEGPRLELFGRESRHGFDVVGDQATLYDNEDYRITWQEVR